MQVKFGAIVTNGSGKIGGQFISSDRNSSSLRTKNFKAKNSQVNTISQRGIVAMMSRAWRELTEAQRQLWQSYATTQSLKNNGYGGDYLSGFQTFMQTNCSFYVDGDSVITEPSFNLNALPVRLLSFNSSNSSSSYNRGDDLGGGVFVCLLTESDPLYIAGKTIALILQKDYPNIEDFFQNNSSFSVNATGGFIGSSVENFNKMLNSIGSYSPIALAVSQLNLGGFSDWVIPSSAAILECAKEPLPVYWLSILNCWSSNEFNSSMAFYLPYGFSSMIPEAKMTSYSCAAVRFHEIQPNSSLYLNLSDNLPSGIKVKISVTKPVSIGISNPRNTFTDLGIFDTSSNSQINLTAAYEAKFGSLSGMSGKIFIKAFVFDSVTKQRSNAFISSTVLS